MKHRREGKRDGKPRAILLNAQAFKAEWDLRGGLAPSGRAFEKGSGGKVISKYLDSFPTTFKNSLILVLDYGDEDKAESFHQ